MATKILVTGAGGFIGTNVLEHYQGRENVEMHAFDLKLPENCCGATRHEGDLLTDNVVERVRPDVIVHLAGLSGVRASDDCPEQYIDVNVKGTVRLFQQARQWKVDLVVYASSSSVYGDTPCPDEELVGKQVSMYALSKFFTEQIAALYYKRYKTKSIGLRFFTVYGPHGRSDMAVGKFANLLSAHSMVPVYGDGTQRRDYTHVDDVVYAIESCVDRRDHLTCHTADVGSGSNASVIDVVLQLSAMFGTQPRVAFLPPHGADVTETLATGETLKNLTGFTTQISFREGLEKFVRWYKSKRDEQPFETQR